MCDGGAIEDEYVEAEVEWPDSPGKAARQLAGMANATAGAIGDLRALLERVNAASEHFNSR